MCTVAAEIFGQSIETEVGNMIYWYTVFWLIILLSLIAIDRASILATALFMQQFLICQNL